MLKRHRILFLAVLFFSSEAFSQQDSGSIKPTAIQDTNQAKMADQPDTAKMKSKGKKEKANVIIQSFDDTRIRARMIGVGYDYLILDAARHTPPADLNRFYVRPYGDQYKIDVEYLKTVSMNKGRVLGQSALMGGIAGAVVMGVIGNFVGRLDAEEEDDPSVLGYTLVGGGMGFVAGGFVGGIVGLFTRKHFKIEGNPEGLRKLELFFGNAAGK